MKFENGIKLITIQEIIDLQTSYHITLFDYLVCCFRKNKMANVCSDDKVLNGELVFENLSDVEWNIAGNYQFFTD